MEIVLENISVKDDDKVIFENLNLNISSNKIIGLYGNKANDFIKLLKTKNVEEGSITDDNILDDLLIINNYNSFITDNVFDEFCLYFEYSKETEKEIINIFSIFGMGKSYLTRNISTLSTTEKKIIKLIIVMYSKNKTIILEDFFKGLDFYNKREFSSFLKNIKRNYNKLVFIVDNDMDTMSHLIDKILIVDENLVTIDELENVFSLDDISKVDIEMPSFIKLMKLVNSKNPEIKCRNINDFIKEVKNNV